MSFPCPNANRPKHFEPLCGVLKNSIDSSHNSQLYRLPRRCRGFPALRGTHLRQHNTMNSVPLLSGALSVVEIVDLDRSHSVWSTS